MIFDVFLFSFKGFPLGLMIFWFSSGFFSRVFWFLGYVFWMIYLRVLLVMFF